MPVRNEAWCLGLTLRVALQWCDEVIVLLHNCTDDSARIVREVCKEVNDFQRGVRCCVWMVKDDPEWNEMQHRQELLESARACDGATHIAIIDTDEFLTANAIPKIRDYVERCPRGTMIEMPGYNIREQPAPGMHYHTNGTWGNRWFATAFVDSPVLNWQGDRFHHREPFGCGWNRWRPLNQGEGGTVHLWGASERRLKAKHALYRITERLRWPQKTAAEIESVYAPATKTQPRFLRNRYGGVVQELLAEAWTFAPVPDEWLAPYAELIERNLRIDEVPWQEAEVRLLLATHGREHFQGLDLLGY